MSSIYFLLAVSLIINIASFFRGNRETLAKGFSKMVANLTSKRFIVLAVATFFVYSEIQIDANWLILAAVYIGLDTAQNGGVFAALAEKLRAAKKD